MLSFLLATPPEMGREIGRRLRTHRLVQELPQDELARRAGVSVGTIKNLEGKGQASLQSFLRMVTALQLGHEMQELFAAQPQSIADMERGERAQRTRAPRRL